MSRVSKSVGRECAAFSCLNPFYNFDGTKVVCISSSSHKRIQRNVFGVSQYSMTILLVNTL